MSNMRLIALGLTYIAITFAVIEDTYGHAPLLPGAILVISGIAALGRRAGVLSEHKPRERP